MKILGTKRVRTTAYHPIVNGLVERFHRQLKAALKAQPNADNWVENLPMVLLGIRTALKEDLQCSTAEMVYGTTLRLPAEFFDSSSSNQLDPVNYVAKLRSTMQQLRATPPHRHSRHKAYISKTFLVVHTYLCVTTAYKSLYSHPIMDLIRSYSGMTRRIPSKSMDNRRWYHWID